MKIKDLIANDIDIDVCDDYDESCWIAKCGAYKLTDEGQKMFNDVLNIGVHILTDPFGGPSIAILECDDENESEAEKNVRACREFFYSLAGYCSAENYDKWFIEV